MINNEKSCIVFFNTEGNVKNHLAKILGFSIGNLLSKYLGIPLSNNPLRNACWQNILEKLNSYGVEINKSGNGHWYHGKD